MVEGHERRASFNMMREMQRGTDALATRKGAGYGVNPLLYVLAEVGGTTGRGLAAADDKDNDLLSSIAIELIDADLRPYSSSQFVSDLQDEVVDHTLAEAVSFRGWRSGPGGDALDVQFFGADTDVLKAAAEALKTALIIFPEVSALEDSLAYDREELILDPCPYTHLTLPPTYSV